MPILQEGYKYHPPGKLDEGLTHMHVLVIVSTYSRLKSKKRERKRRKEVIKRLKQEGLI